MTQITHEATFSQTKYEACNTTTPFHITVPSVNITADILRLILRFKTIDSIPRVLL